MVEAEFQGTIKVNEEMIQQPDIDSYLDGARNALSYVNV